jgi:hypothetical protein
MGLDANQILQKVFDPVNSALKLQGGGTGSGTKLAVWSGSEGSLSGRIQSAATRDNGVYQFTPAPAAAPSDALILINEAVIYVDGTNLKIRVRKADSSLVTATIALV